MPIDDQPSGPPFAVKDIASDDEMYAAIGRLVTAYAVTKGTLTLALRIAFGMDEEKGNIVFADLGLSEMSNRLRRILLANRDEGNAAELDAVLEQLSLIDSQYERLVHRNIGLNSNSAGLVVSEFMFAKTDSLSRVCVVSMDDIAAMREDCNTICMRLILIVFRRSIEPEVWRNLSVVFTRPWFFKKRTSKNRIPNQKPAARLSEAKRT